MDCRRAKHLLIPILHHLKLDGLYSAGFRCFVGNESN